MSEDVAAELIQVSRDWDRAMVGNDPDEIGRFMADDWTIVGSDGGIVTKTRFLALVRSGALAHDVMESDDFQVRVYGDTGVVIARGVSGGTYEGHPFREVERSSCCYVKQAGRWRCVLTHLSKLVPPDGR